MLSVRYTTQFKKDLKRAGRRGKDLEKLKTVIELLISGEPLLERYRDHELTGKLKGVRDCHIESDRLLLYQADDEEVILIRTGTHSDLFRQ